MRNTIVSLVVLGLTFSSLQAQELSKEEKKALLSEIKAMKKSPEKLMKMKQDLEFADIVVDQQTELISGLKKDVQIKEMELNETKSKLESAESALEKSKEVLGNLNQTESSPAPMNHNGTKYRVQIGLFENLDFSDLFSEPKYMVHEFVAGANRYSIGNFNTEADAEAFKKEMRKLGISGAFVSTYTEGMRTDNLGMSQAAPVKTENVAPTPTKVEVAIPKSTGFNVKPATTTPKEVKESVIINEPVQVVPNVPVKDQNEFEFRDESSKSSGLKIKVNK